jgi:hypothetical protein
MQLCRAEPPGGSWCSTLPPAAPTCLWKASGALCMLGPPASCPARRSCCCRCCNRSWCLCWTWLVVWGQGKLARHRQPAFCGTMHDVTCRLQVRQRSGAVP